MKKVVYTALIGDYDNLVTPPIHNKDWQYICFTNQDVKSDFWEVRNIDVENDPKIARELKIRPHAIEDIKKFDYSVWLDCNIVQKCDMNKMLATFEKYDMATMQHPTRSCIYTEGQVCGVSGKDDPYIIQRQLNKYMNEGYKERNGLIASGILFRHHNRKNIINLMDDWHKEVRAHSVRDQLSFNYVLEKHKVNIGYMPYHVLQTKFVYYAHK